MLSAASVEDDNSASITLPSEASGSSSANSHNKRKRSVFRAWQFHFMIKTDLRDSTAAVEKESSSQTTFVPAQGMPRRSLS
jgi:hypothetical protein